MSDTWTAVDRYVSDLLVGRDDALEAALAASDAAGLADAIAVRVGRAIDSLPQLLAEGRGPFDLVFIDADRVGYPEYLERSLKLSKPGTVIIADNVVRNGAVADAENADVSVQAVRRYNAMLATEPRVTATIVQTVGSKGYDGLAIALVTA